MLRYFFVVILCCLTLAGCRTPQVVKNAWKGTRSYYYEYLNTPAELDLENKGDALNYQAALGAAIADFDLQLQELERSLQNSDRRPDADWVESMTARFPWLSGIALTDDAGFPRAKVPLDFPKPFEIGSLIEVDEKQQLKDLRAYVHTHDLGPEIYLGNPVYVGADFRGVITVHFDPRVLLARTGDPAKVMIASPEGVIWPGHYDAAATPVAGVDWGEMVTKNYSGLIKNELGTFYWVCRYLGNLPLVYAIKTEGEFPLAEENLRGIADAHAFAIGRVDLAALQMQPDEEAPPVDPASQTLPEGDTPPPAPPVPPIEITPDGSNSPLAAPEPEALTAPDGDAKPLSE